MSKSLPDEVFAHLSTIFRKNSISKISKFTSLWAGYGSIFKISLNNDVLLIIKYVSPPLNNKTLSTTSNARKLQSYNVELYFYKYLSSTFINIGSIPQSFSTVKLPSGALCFVMSDLTAKYPSQLGVLNLTHTLCALNWLARFHGHFWNYRNNDKGVWDDGSYWALSTRQEELNAISLKHRVVRERAMDIDKACRDPRFETLIHGDPKSENILWTENGFECAFYDFQYVGIGLGAKDIAYLLCSSVDEDELKNEEEFLRFYLLRLSEVVVSTGKSLNGYNFEQLIVHFENCLLDYVRFMMGWGMWGNYKWALERTKDVLRRIET
ncbi:hypothetical protein HK096_007839 [Nowakowskiella sp. JEL0078]|nr:hypothetical protein HK096_007839 [Nowakowskiella sp. JEL0078]